VCCSPCRAAAIRHSSRTDLFAHAAAGGLCATRSPRLAVPSLTSYRLNRPRTDPSSRQHVSAVPALAQASMALCRS